MLREVEETAYFAEVAQLEVRLRQSGIHCAVNVRHVERIGKEQRVMIIIGRLGNIAFLLRHVGKVDADGQ